MEWRVQVSGEGANFSVHGQGDAPNAVALVDAHEAPPPLRNLYELPPGVQAVRLCRVRAFPPGEGGGTAVLSAAMAFVDSLGAWSVLEASPYAFSKMSEAELVAFYKKHGFELVEGAGSLMSRPPGGRSSSSPA